MSNKKTLDILKLAEKEGDDKDLLLLNINF
jgi:hypothetical protein